jgi:putative DNA primase/helicase
MDESKQTTVENSNAISSDVPLNVELEEVSLTLLIEGEDDCIPEKVRRKNERNVKLKSDIEITGGTKGTGGTANSGAASSGSPEKNTEGTGGTQFNLEDAINPLHEPDESQIKQLSFDDLKLPCYIVENDWFNLGGKRKPGVWYCYETAGTEKKPPAQIALRICSPLYIAGVTNTEDGRFYGRLLQFRDTLGHWREWAMPMELLRGSGEELRGELLAAGVEIEQRNRARIAEYLQWRTPKEVVTAATRTGWTAKGGAFVLHDRIIGAEQVHFQSETLSADGAAKTGGDYHQWQAMAALCEGNPVLIVSVCVALSGALLVKVHRDSGGIHWVDDSSTGKTTALCVGGSSWGGDDFKRTWRATSNSLEGVAALLSDTCLCLDEINEADPREVGAIVYSLGNGTGKTRATRIGSARQVHRWRLSLLSTGERSITAMMQEGGKQAKAGQLVRLLNISSARKYGVFDNLHTFTDGRELADHLKTECSKHYGHAGIKFVEHIINQGNADFGATLAQIETQFSHSDTQAARAASRFAVYAMAGELAIEAGILSWQEGAALEACKVMFEAWQTMRGTGATEHKQILQNVADYILKHGDTKFTDKNIPDDKPRLDRAGWYTDRPEGRVYLFSSAALREAGGSYDFNRVLDAMDSAGWIVEKSSGKRSKTTAIIGGARPHLYWILPAEDSDHA